jgi:hypothetical protein
MSRNFSEGPVLKKVDKTGFFVIESSQEKRYKKR